MTKRRDLQVTIHDVRVHYFTEEDTDLFVAWPGAPTFEELTATKWRENPELFARAKAVAKEANAASHAPIRLQVEKNGLNCRIHYVCPDVRKLPPAPEQIERDLLSRFHALIGARLRLWKDHTMNGYLAGYVDEEMVHWEDLNGCKASGRLEADLADGRRIKIPDFKSGRQDYWGGFAIEALVSLLNADVTQTTYGTMGADLSIEEVLAAADSGEMASEEVRRAAKRIGKHALLRDIQSILHLNAKQSDVSRGSTVTRSALRLVALRISARSGATGLDISSKASCIKTCLRLLDEPSEESDVSRGGTVTAYALFKIRRGLVR